MEFSKWALVEGIETLTVFAFSTENWKRGAEEVAQLMELFVEYCEEMRVEAKKRNIRVRILSSDEEKIPMAVRRAYTTLVRETSKNTGMAVNICMSYGSRSEICQVLRGVINEVNDGLLRLDDVDEDVISKRLLTSGCGGDPDVVIRTSGEMRLSNFLLWQLAYSEMYFWDKKWPEVTKKDLVDMIRNFAKGRERRFGK